MSPSLAYAEVLAAAIRVEENGARFYRQAADEALDPATAKVFSSLAAMEDEHRGYFGALARQLEQRESLFENDPAGDFSASVRYMADAGIPGLGHDPADFFDGKRSSKEAVEFAIGIEKDSIVFYLSLQDAMADKKEADKLGAIIREELHHIFTLRALLKQMAD